MFGSLVKVIWCEWGSQIEMGGLWWRRCFCILPLGRRAKCYSKLIYLLCSGVFVLSKAIGCSKRLRNWGRRFARRSLRLLCALVTKLFCNYDIFLVLLDWLFSIFRVGLYYFLGFFFLYDLVFFHSFL